MTIVAMYSIYNRTETGPNTYTGSAAVPGYVWFVASTRSAAERLTRVVGPAETSLYCHLRNFRSMH